MAAFFLTPSCNRRKNLFPAALFTLTGFDSQRTIMPRVRRFSNREETMSKTEIPVRYLSQEDLLRSG